MWPWENPRCNLRPYGTTHLNWPSIRTLTHAVSLLDPANNDGGKFILEMPSTFRYHLIIFRPCKLSTYLALRLCKISSFFFILGCGNKHISRILSEIHHFYHRYAANDLSEKLHLVNTSKCTKNAAVLQFAHEFIMIIKGSSFLRQIACYWLPPLN